MSAARAADFGLDEPGPRWLGAALVVLVIHAGLIAALDRLADQPPPAAPAPLAILIDLEAAPAPAPPAPPVVEPPIEPEPILEAAALPEIDIPLPPILEEPLPEPVFDVPPIEAPVVEQPAVALIPPPPRRPPVDPPPRATTRAPRVPDPPAAVAARPAPAAPTTALPAPQAAAPAPSEAPARMSNAVPSWQGLLLAHLERHKRYPASARSRRQEGLAQLRFTIDREGKVVAAELMRSSGVPTLDEETMAMLERAAPLPAPPPELARATVELVVPVRFSLK